MKRRTLERAAIAALVCAALAAASNAVATPIYATSLVAASNVTPFGSGTVTGPPDIGGLWLGSTLILRHSSVR